MKLVIFVLLALVPMSLLGQFEVGVAGIDASENRALVQLRANNKLDKPIRNARLMVLLLDDNGKVVGADSRWVTKQNSDAEEHIESGAQKEFPVVVKTKSKASRVQVICSRLVHADGSLADPRKQFRQVEIETNDN